MWTTAPNWGSRHPISVYYSVIKQHNLVPIVRWWCFAAGEVTAGLAKRNSSLPPGAWLMTAGWLPVQRDQPRAQRSITSMGSPCTFLTYGHVTDFSLSLATARTISWGWLTPMCRRSYDSWRDVGCGYCDWTGSFSSGHSIFNQAFPGDESVDGNDGGGGCATLCARQACRPALTGRRCTQSQIWLLRSRGQLCAVDIFRGKGKERESIFI